MSRVKNASAYMPPMNAPAQTPSPLFTSVPKSRESSIVRCGIPGEINPA